MLHKFHFAKTNHSLIAFVSTKAVLAKYNRQKNSQRPKIPCEFFVCLSVPTVLRNTVPKPSVFSFILSF